MTERDMNMPGPVSDSYDPEWGTSAKAEEIADALQSTYVRISGVLGNQPPKDIRSLVSEEIEHRRSINATLTEWEWRIIRFALERAKDSL